jgi:CRISPR-associated protein Csm1
MSAQILLEGRLEGQESFPAAPPADRDNRAFESRLLWLTLLGEVVPRALLAHLGLPPLMLGSSGGGRFLVILPDQSRAEQAGEFLAQVRGILAGFTATGVDLIWSSTENLGDWTVVRKRLEDEIERKRRSRAAEPGFFDPFTPPPASDRIPRDLRDATSVGFGFDISSLIAAPTDTSNAGTHKWDLGRQAGIGNIPLARHAARSGDTTAGMKDLARRAHGRRLWGVLRGQIDDYATRMRRLQSVEEHVQLSILYKQFLAGEIELLCSQAEFFQRVTVLETANASFALAGSWDALIAFARELQRVFTRFAEENLKDLPGAEAKTVTMALAIAEQGDSLARVWEDCGRSLEAARAADKDCFTMLGRVLEWKQLNDASELRDTVSQLAEEFRGGRHFLEQLRALYRKVETSDAGDNDRLMARALRFHRRFDRPGSKREREFQKLRAHLMKELAGRKTHGRLRLRPEGLVALEWARLGED